MLFFFTFRLINCLFFWLLGLTLSRYMGLFRPRILFFRLGGTRKVEDGCLTGTGFFETTPADYIWIWSEFFQQILRKKPILFTSENIKRFSFSFFGGWAGLLGKDFLRAKKCGLHGLGDFFSYFGFGTWLFITGQFFGPFFLISF